MQETEALQILIVACRDNPPALEALTEVVSLHRQLRQLLISWLEGGEADYTSYKQGDLLDHVDHLIDIADYVREIGTELKSAIVSGELRGK